MAGSAKMEGISQSLIMECATFICFMNQKLNMKKKDRII